VTAQWADVMGTWVDGSNVFVVVVSSDGLTTVIRDDAGKEHIFPHFSVVDAAEGRAFLEAVRLERGNPGAL
jgi:hypothetical protein